MTGFPPPSDQPLVLRVPPAQTAAAFLIAAAAAAAVIYTGLSGGARIVCALVAFVAAASGTVAARAYLVADTAGVGLRRVFGELSVPWDDVVSIEVVVRKNQPSIYLFRNPGTPVRVPSFLALPLVPSTGMVTARRLQGLAKTISQQRPGPAGSVS
ncbi:MAG: PH domain-containing protein [Actinomycetota bacterium]|nr:PH domain-containing protein [Actinomycetota bacterium]